MTGLLWALETLAWDANRLSRVVICLGELAARDPGGHWANRPANSLRTILLPWLPQTCAPISKRSAALSILLAELPDVGWKLLISLLPAFHSSSFMTRRPAWQETIPDDWPTRVLNQEIHDQYEIYSDMAVTAAKSSSQRLIELIDHLEQLPRTAHDQLLIFIASDKVMKMPEMERLGIWTKLVDLVTKHRKFSDAKWAMIPEQVDKIARIAEQLAPQAPELRYQRFFNESDLGMFEEKGNYEDQRIELEDRRKKAIEEIASNGGVEAVFAFAITVQSPWRVGIAFGAVKGNEIDCMVLPALLESKDKLLTQFVCGFVIRRFQIGGWQWVDSIETSGWTPEEIGQFLSFLPFILCTWERVTRLLGEDEALYWKITNANSYETDSGFEFAIDKLIHYGRPYAALRCFNRMLHNQQKIDIGRAVRGLLAALQSTEDVNMMDAYEIIEIIKALQDAPETNPDDLFHVEWAYLRLLDHHHASPKLLERRLATDPEFFCEVIRIIFRSKNKAPSTEGPTEETRKIASNAYQLLSQWRTPPGLREDGSFDGGALNYWLESVKKKCLETGHLERALTMLGHVLTHVPPASDGLWIDRSAAAILNAKDAGDIRDGFRTERYNSRGVHSVDPTGQSERKIAEKYRNQAEAVEIAGYNRLATTLRELAASYEREAERTISREQFDD